MSSRSTCSTRPPSTGRSPWGGAALWVETPINPLLRVADLAELGAICARHGTLTVADNTVATAVLQQPARFGAAATVYSLTKAVAGHSTSCSARSSLRTPSWCTGCGSGGR
ncbi:MAG TPA: PLP-dependent transferase [Euzebyales bacterium]|nr:PLP-dependent transferase [Euzebyales bacterium]